jgi:hypothetical protein
MAVQRTNKGGNRAIPQQQATQSHAGGAKSLAVPTRRWSLDGASTRPRPATVLGKAEMVTRYGRLAHVFLNDGISLTLRSFQRHAFDSHHSGRANIRSTKTAYGLHHRFVSDHHTMESEIRTACTCLISQGKANSRFPWG